LCSRLTTQPPVHVRAASGGLFHLRVSNRLRLVIHSLPPVSADVQVQDELCKN